jgi:pyruvate/2-oxoglutarate dehydrogenase complex dihydrolipoamide acyltransferase (E2) component/uncharacterized OsmC-like protein
MGYVIKMPKLGLEMERGELLAWTVGVDESVEEGDVIAEVESEKSVAEIEARENGAVRRTYLDAGETVPPGTPIGILAASEEEIDGLEAEVEAELDGADEPADASGSAGESTTDEPASRSEANGPGAVVETESRPAADEPKASPRARQRAEELGVTLATVEGTGYQGSITEDDVEAAADSGAAAESGRTLAEERPFDGMRRTIASRLGESYREAVHVTTHRTADAEALFAASDAADRSLDAEVSVQDVLLLAVSAALDAYPEFNATFEDDVHRLWAEHNVGVAVDIEQGLIAPVLRDVGNKSLETMASERRDLVGAAAAGEHTMDDLQGGTFTVTNLGVLGVESFDPIINPPQVAILGVGAVAERPVRGANDDPEWRRRLPLDLSFDHRVVDGADAARFLETLVGHVEDPWSLLPAEIDEGATPGAPTEMPGRTVSARNHEGMAGTIEAGSFEWAYDEPEEAGGTETGPTPVDAFLGGLAACLSLSIRYQAEKRDTPIGEIDVEVDAEPEHGSVETLSATIRLETGADDETVARLVEIGERGCHVSQLLRDDLSLAVSWSRF